MEKYVKETELLNYSHCTIRKLITTQNWSILSEKNRILSVYNFVRDDIIFGYNRCDALSASDVLKDNYGQCNTKGILFMALLRALNIPCRIHGFTIDKRLQKGAMTGITYLFAPKEIVHSWIEVYYHAKWYYLEGYILDHEYLGHLQNKFPDCIGDFCGYGVATDDFKNPPIDWNENNTYIQNKGIIKDFGIFDSPDELFQQHRQPLSVIKRSIYQNFSRHRMNRNIKKIRSSHKAIF